MNLGQLSGWLQANKTEAVMVGGAAVAGLALYSRKKKGAAAPAAAAGAVPGTIPAAAVVPAGAADSSSFDAYNALQDEIGTLARQNEAARQTGAGGSGVGSAVKAPLASSLFAPNMTGQYVGYKGTGAGGNSINEVESDGSLYHLSMPEWLSIIQANGGKTPTTVDFTGTAPSDYTGTANLQKKINTAAGA